jgi:ABC-type glycerol-3-phosphate transport system substrate-binding protein
MVWKASTRRGALLQGTLVAGAMGGLAACAPGSTAPTEPAGGASNRPLSLIWAVRPSSAPPEAREKLLQEYKEARPNVTVEQIDASGGIAPSLEKIAAAMAAGTPIDIINGHLAARQLIESIDAVQPIDDLVRRDRFDLNRYNKEALDATGRYDGKLYTLTYAYGGDVAAVAYNKALFRGAGVPEPSSDWSKPWTWDEFRDAMRRLTKSAGSELTQVGLAGFGFWVHTPIMQWGARWLTPDYKTVVCDSQQTIDAFTKFDDLLFKDRVTAQSPGANLGTGNAFLTGKAAVNMPCCAALNFARSTRGQNIEWAFITMPRGTVSTLDVSPVVMGIAKTSKQKEAAWEFLKYVDDKSRLAVLEDRMPGVLPDMLPWIKSNFAEWPDSRAEMLAEGMKVAKPLEPLRYHAQWQKMAQEVIDPGWADILAQRRSMVDFLRAAKPMLQNIVDDHARARGK